MKAPATQAVAGAGQGVQERAAVLDGEQRAVAVSDSDGLAGVGLSGLIGAIGLVLSDVDEEVVSPVVAQLAADVRLDPDQSLQFVFVVGAALKRAEQASVDE